MDKLLEEIYTMDKGTMEECAKHVMLGGGTRGMPIILRGKGVRVSDVNGKSYIDCTSQSWALYLDYANDDLNSFVCEHLQGMSHVHQGFDTPIRYYLAGQLADIVPCNLNRVSFTVGGGRADYVSAKAGMEGLNRAIIREFGPFGVRCNVVHPSLIETDLLTQRQSDPSVREKLAAGVPLRRLGQPNDMAHMVVFLLSNLASYVTGQSILVDGWRTQCG